MYSLEYTDISQIFLHATASAVTSARCLFDTYCTKHHRLRPLLLETNNESSNGIQGHCCKSVMRGHCCEPATCIVKTAHSNSGLVFFCSNIDVISGVVRKRDKQTYGHGRTQNVHFDDARARKTLNNSKNVEVVFPPRYFLVH